MVPSAGSKGTDLTRAEFLKIAAGTAAGAYLILSGSCSWALEGPLLTRKIPRTGEALPVVGLGTAGSFGWADDAQAYRERKEVLRVLLEGGGKLVDTSPTYGSAEAVVGRSLEELGLRNKSFIATKISTSGAREGIEQYRQSVKDLRTPKIDLLQVHNLRDVETQLKTVRRLKDEGKVRYIGVTHYQPSAYDRLAAVLSREDLDFVQLNYSLEARQAEKTILPLARDRGLAVLVNLPFGRGALFRKVRGKKLPPWAADFDAASWGQVFLKFILARNAVTTVIPGTTDPRHMRDNLGAGRGRLPDAAHVGRIVEYMSKI